jgi:hypothetical protein
MTFKPLAQPFTNNLMDAILRGKTDEELESIIKARPPATIRLDELDPALVFEHPVLDADGRPDHEATEELAAFYTRAQTMLNALPAGNLTREQVIAHGFQQSDFDRMIELEQRRLVATGNRQQRRAAKHKRR